jgi:hypothetical protein
MRRMRERIRLAAKAGWHCGKGRHECNPFGLYDADTEFELCIAFEKGWSLGVGAADGDVNPFGIQAVNRAPVTGWYIAGGVEKAHFFKRGQIQSRCAMVSFCERFERTQDPFGQGHVLCKVCSRR